jgi:hypothetical protein
LIQKLAGMRFVTVTLENNRSTGALPGKPLGSYDRVV